MRSEKVNKYDGAFTIKFNIMYEMKPAFLDFYSKLNNNSLKSYPIIAVDLLEHCTVDQQLKFHNYFEAICKKKFE